jgi:N-dimethylarginine dimethylaminohydrolase
MNSFNEWDRLREVVVGSATNANWPSDDLVFAQEKEKTLWKETPVPAGPVPNWIVNEANEDLEVLSDILEEEGVIVHRPRDIDFVARGGMYNYCPRDRLIVVGDRIIDTAMMYPCRDIEIEALDFVIERARDVYTMPRDQGLVLDAANICRLNDDWLFLESASGNRAAYEWLCQNVPNVRIELCNFYAGVHIDSTIVPLREGLVLLNASRVTPNTCPRVFDGWDKIWVEDVVPQGFHEYPYASKWIALNMLSLSPDIVIMDADQPDLRRTLESRGITVIPHRLRHSRTLGGGFHCVTLDIVRQP